MSSSFLWAWSAEMGTESGVLGPPSSLGHREERLCAALIPGTSVTQVSEFGQA